MSESSPNDAKRQVTSNYVLNDPEFALVMPWPLTDPDVMVRHVFRQSVMPAELLGEKERMRSWVNPDDQIIQNLLDGIKRDTEVQQRGREIFTYSEDKGYALHFDQAILKTYSKDVGSDAPEHELSEIEASDLTVEHRAAAARQRYESTVKVDRGGTSILFEGKGEIICTQIIGDELTPAFVIEQVWKRPGGERRIKYRDDTSKVETQRDGRNATRRAITDIKPAMGMAREYFVGVRSGLDINEGQPYEMGNDDHRILFLKNYNKMWLVDVVERLIESFQKPARD